MRNPIYTTNDISIYNFFKAHGSTIINPPEQFNGVTSQYLFSGTNTNRKTWDLSGHNVVVAPHQGFIPPDMWLACRKKLLANHQIKTCKAKNSFLSDKIKCGNCGYAIAVRYSPQNRKRVRYFIDTGWTEHHCCNHKLPTIHADEFEQVVVERIKNKLSQMLIKPKEDDNSESQRIIQEYESKIASVESEIEILVDKLLLSDLDKTAIKYINKKISSLDKEKDSLSDEIEKIKAGAMRDKGADFKKIDNAMSKWDELSFDDKRSVVEVLIEKILVFPDKIEIRWKVYCTDE